MGKGVELIKTYFFDFSRLLLACDFKVVVFVGQISGGAIAAGKTKLSAAAVALVVLLVFPKRFITSCPILLGLGNLALTLLGKP